MKKIGEIYKEKVLDLPKNLRKKIELPTMYDEVKIENDLFGWWIYSKRTHLKCKSEYEARYLKFFIELGFSEVYIPRDEEYLKNLIIELEKTKEKIDKIIEKFTIGIVSKKLKKRIIDEVYMEVIKY